MTTAIKTQPIRAHDPKARAVAKAVYDALNPRSVILFGSRARGDFRRDSDVDLLVITDDDRVDKDEYMAACDAAHAKSAELYGVRSMLGVDVVTMSADKSATAAAQKTTSRGKPRGTEWI